MDNIIIKVDNKRILPLFIVLMIFSILFLLGIIISLLYNLLGYTIYFLIILFILLMPLYIEFIWLKRVYIDFTNEKIILNVLVVKNVTKKCKPKFYYPFQYRNVGGLRSRYATRFATVEKSEIKYSDIIDYKITSTNDLEIITNSSKYVIRQSLFGYKPWVDQQFTKDQLQFVFDELKHRISN